MIVFGWCIVGLTGAVLFVNALVMLVSPKAWFRLPHWIRAQGSLTQQQYGRGWGAVQVRLTGAGMLALILWVLYDSLIIK